MVRRLFIIAGLLITSYLKAQIVIDSPKKEWEEELLALVADTNHSSIAELDLALKEAGFWLAQWQDSTLVSGPKLALGELILEDQSIPLGRKTLNSENWNEALNRVLDDYSNRGYPFAVLNVGAFHIEEDRVFAEGKIQPGVYLEFDSLVVLGYDKIDRSLLYYESNWQVGRHFSNKYLQEIEANIEASEYLTNSRSPAIAFYPEGSQIYLYLNKRSSNQISGVVGLNTNNQGETSLTGDFELKLLNTFNHGEAFDLRWSSPQSNSQDFHLSFNYPYVLGSPIGMGAGLEIFRQDSSFVRRKLRLNTAYRLAYQSFFKINGFYDRSNPLQSSGEMNSALASVERLGAGIGFRLVRLNQRIVATKGYLLDLELKSAERRTDKLSETQYSWSAEAAYYSNFWGPWVWHQSLKSEGLNGSNLFQNELDRFGGIQSLRGFNEWQFFTSTYLLSRNEIRFMLGKLDYLCLLFDAAYTENASQNSLISGFHTGLGLGMNFQTKGGIFSLFLAVGQSDADPYDFRASKVHLSYINTF